MDRLSICKKVTGNLLKHRRLFGIQQLSASTSNLNPQVMSTVNQELTWFDTETYQEKTTEEREVLADSTCYDTTCSAAGSGQSDLWNAYYKSDKATRVDALANAIKGIGKKSAQGLVAGKYFTSKPRSWNDFANEINRAADAGAIHKSTATQVLQTYRSDNITALGYGAGQCQEKARTCQTWIRKAFDVYVPAQRKVERKKISDSRQFAVDVQVVDPKLMSTEHDPVQFHITENGQVPEQVVMGSYNRYKVSSVLMGPRKTQVKLTSDQRFFRNLPQNVIRQDQFLKVGTTPTFILDVDPNDIPNNEDPNSQLVVDYTVKTCNLSWLGTCKWGAYQAVKVASAIITQQRTQISTDLPKGTKGWVEYAVSRRNSQFFNPEVVNRTSDSIKN